MIVTDGVVWINSKAICAVGALKNGSFPVILDSLSGPIQLNYEDVNYAYAVRISVILRLDPSDKDLSNTIEFLLKQAEKEGFKRDVIIPLIDKINGKE